MNIGGDRASAKRYFFGLMCLVAALGLSGSTRADTVTTKVRGLNDAQEANVRAFLSIATKSSDKANLSSDQIARWHALAEQEIQLGLQPFGYYSPSVIPALEETAPGEWQAQYEILPGPASRWRHILLRVDGAGAADALVAELRDHSLSKEGERIDHGRYEAHKRNWLSQMYAAGYLDAQFKHSHFTVDLDGGVADLDWEFDTGPRYTFGDILINQDILRPSLVHRYHTIQPGDVFDTQRLIDLQLDLNNSNYFETVQLDIRKDEAKSTVVPVVFNTTARKRRRYDLGLGYGTDTGPRVTAGIESRRVNRRGHRYRVNTRASAIESALQFEYDIPIENVATDRWRMYAQVERADVGDADATSYSLGAAREDGWRGARRRVFVNAEHSSFRFGDEPSQSATLIYPGIGLSFDRLDNPQFVRRGFSVAATLQGGLDSLGSSTDFLSAQFSGRAIAPLGKRGRLLLATDMRIVEAESFSSLPPSQRFFLGGDRSVRGYAFQSISPENEFGDDIGGSRALGVNVEVDYQLRNRWGVAAFFDAGDVSDSLPTNFRKGAGLGLRYRSAVGMIRVDLAHPFDESSSDVRLHLSIGPDL